MPKSPGQLTTAFLSGILLSLPSLAEDLSFTITIRDHRFEPAEIVVPAGKRATLIVKNLDASAEEFESRDLRIEKVIPPRKEARLLLRPLKPGTYEFVGEFHEDTARGRIVAK